MTKRRCRKDKADEADAVSIDNEHHMEVSVDGQALPLKIGDKVNVGDGIMRVVMKMQINEDCGVAYGLQWLDGTDFKLNWFTYSELCYMSEMMKSKPTVKFLNS